MPEPVSFFQLIAHIAGRLPTELVATWTAMALLLIVGYAARSSLSAAADPTVPDEGLTLRHFAEVAVERLDVLVAQISELHGAANLGQHPLAGDSFRTPFRRPLNWRQPITHCHSLARGAALVLLYHQ